jgi:hypothetical protein
MGIGSNRKTRWKQSIDGESDDETNDETNTKKVKQASVGVRRKQV